MTTVKKQFLSGKSIAIDKNVTNFNIVKKNDGIIFNPKNYELIKELNPHKSWLIVLDEDTFQHFNIFTDIHQRTYFILKDRIIELYKFRNLHVREIIGYFNSTTLEWNPEVKRNIYDRRGNFQSMTLNAVTLPFAYKQIISKNCLNNNGSVHVPESYEVHYHSN